MYMLSMIYVPGDRLASKSVPKVQREIEKKCTKSTEENRKKKCTKSTEEYGNVHKCSKLNSLLYFE